MEKHFWVILKSAAVTVFAPGEKCIFFRGGASVAVALFCRSFFDGRGKRAHFVFALKGVILIAGEKKYTPEDCVRLLVEKSRELDRYPARADFSDAEVVAIKAHLGPWPRALEAAGLKPPRDIDRLEKNREKRRRAKIARREQKLENREK